MPFADRYRAQVALLIRVLPLVAEQSVFALKGGTAINLFIRNLPRLSVDIDLAYLPVAARAESLAGIDAAMKSLARRIIAAIPGANVHEARLAAEGIVHKLAVQAGGVQILVEVSPVLRGCVFEPVLRSVSPPVQEQFGFAEVPIVSLADLYAGKIVAALDRQHPRDLFDVRDLLANEGIDDDLRRAFLVYLISHDRPMHEVLAPTRKDIATAFERTFQGMTEESVDLAALLGAREALIKTIVGEMPDDHRRFLLSFERGEPDWALLGIHHAPSLPAVLWRQRNLDSLSTAARAELVRTLERVLGAVSGGSSS
jgi:predicted nucleotidyltransferase component of viral defense system